MEINRLLNDINDLLLEGNDTVGKLLNRLKELEDNIKVTADSISLHAFTKRSWELLKDFWGGYRVEFKLLEKERLKDFSGDMEKMRKSAMALGSGEKKPFTIDISKHEFCGPKAEKELDGFTIYVYTPEMMVIEKVRAICQQMPEYPYGTKVSGYLTPLGDCGFKLVSVKMLRRELPVIFCRLGIGQSLEEEPQISIGLQAICFCCFDQAVQGRA